MIRLKELKINNFRGFKGEHKLVFDDFEPTVLVGVNGAGKTSILEAIIGCLRPFSNKISTLFIKFFIFI